MCKISPIAAALSINYFVITHYENSTTYIYYVFVYYRLVMKND